MAAIGFSSISHTPARTFIICGLAAAVGHALRYVMMSPCLGNINIILASTAAAFAIGLLAVLLAPVVRVPAEACLFPSLLPMIPGIYAYKAFGGLAMCLLHKNETDFMHYFYLFADNGLTCVFIILAMVVGATMPIFMFKHISFRATRNTDDL